jgi:carbonic anhydrase
MLIDGAVMQKVLHFDSPREHYHCDAAVVWCFDHRFELAFRKLLKRTGVLHPDAIRIAGGAKCLATPDRESDREFVLDQIRKSVRLHGTDSVVLMVHSDCGAYGGLAAFGSDAQAESRHHADELRRAAECVRQALPEISLVWCYYVDFEGVWIADPEPGSAHPA